MTIGKAENGGATFHLTEMEYERLNSGQPVTRRTAYCRGVVEFELVRRIVCPNDFTRRFIRDVVNAKLIIPGLNILALGQVTVSQLLAAINRNADTAQQIDVQRSLARFIAEVGGDIPIGKLLD